MQWQVILTTLTQPAFTDEAAQEKAEMLENIFNLLDGRILDIPLDEPMDDEDTIALLHMAGRDIVRKVNARS